MRTARGKPGWLTRDIALVLGARSTRGFGFGFLTVLLGVRLERLDFSGAQVGAVLTGAVAGSTLASLTAATVSDRLGRRRSLVFFGVLMAAAAAGFAFTTSFPLLVTLAFAGTFGVAGQDPFLTLEHALIPQSCPPAERNNAFAAFSLMGAAAAAVGSLASAVPGLLEHGGVSEEWAFRAMFLAYAALALAMLAFHARLSSGVEATELNLRGERPPAAQRRLLARLAALFAVDAFAGGFIVQSFLAYWLLRRFDPPVEQLALVFFAGGVLTALSFPVSAWLANRFGQVATMVFTHLPSNVFLILIPLAPTWPLALAFLLMRYALSSMDVPARQSYIVSVVPPAQRTAAAGVTGAARSVAAAPGPAVAGALVQIGAMSLPFFVSGGVKIAYDLTLFALFRRVKPLEEAPVGQAEETSRPVLPPLEGGS